MKRNGLSIFTKVAFSAWITVAVCIFVVEIFNLSVIRRNQKRAEELYESSLKYYCEFWGERMRMLNKSMLQLAGRTDSADYITLCESDNQLSVEVSKMQLCTELGRIADQNDNRVRLFILAPERGCFLSSSLNSDEEEEQISLAIREKIERGFTQNAGEWKVLWAGDTVYLVQIYHIRSAYIGAIVKGEEVLSDLWGGERIADAVEIRQEDGTVIAHFGKKLEKSRGTILTFDQKLSQTDVYLTAVLEDSRLYRGSSYMLLMLLGIIGLVLLVLSAELVMQNKVVFEPLEKFRRAMERFSSGETQVRLEPYKGNRQIGRLYQTFNEMTEQIVHLKVSVYEKELEKQRIKSNYLRVQIQPHFYANILNLIYGMAQIKEYTGIQKLSRATADYFRYLLGERGTLVPLSEELKGLKSFVEIEQIRYKDRVQIQVEVQEGLESQLILPLLIQTFVENSVKHNVTLIPVLKVQVHVYREDGMLQIRVEDNGTGFAGEVLQKIRNRENLSVNGEHIGITNIQERIRLLYEKDADLRIESAKGHTVVAICLPEVVQMPVSEEKS